MAKRLTKKQAEDKAKAALLQRVEDVYSGACGYMFDPSDEFASAETLSLVMPVLKEMFGTDANDYLWSLRNLGDFESPETATDVLFRNGVRA